MLVTQCHVGETFGVDALPDFRSFSQLKNSEVLKDIGTVLHHLSESQQSELKQLIVEYPNLFADVPSFHI